MARHRRSHGIAVATATATCFAFFAFWQSHVLGIALQVATGAVRCSQRPRGRIPTVPGVGRLAGGSAAASGIVARGLALTTSGWMAAASIGAATEDFEEMRKMQGDLEAMRKSPNPRGGRRVGGDVWFDITLGLPLGIRLDESPQGDMVGVSEIIEGGSAFEHNKASMLPKDDSKKKMWLQPGDRLLMVNGVRCNTQEEAVALITGAKDGQNINLKFSRSARGPVTVVFPEPARQVTVPPQTSLSDAALSAGHPVEYDCEDGLCGKCWHVDDRSGEIYQFCVSGTRVCDVPSKGGVRNLDIQLKGLFDAVRGVEAEALTTFDNTDPLVLRPCPEIHEVLMNPYVGTWRYLGGQYTISRTEDGTLLYTENGISGALNKEGDWLVAELDPHGTIRIKPSESQGLSRDMDSNFRPAGAEAWGETKTAYRE